MLLINHGLSTKTLTEGGEGDFVGLKIFFFFSVTSFMEENVCAVRL